MSPIRAARRASWWSKGKGAREANGIYVGRRGRARGGDAGGVRGDEDRRAGGAAESGGLRRWCAAAGGDYGQRRARPVRPAALRRDRRDGGWSRGDEARLRARRRAHEDRALYLQEPRL